MAAYAAIFFVYICLVASPASSQTTFSLRNKRNFSPVYAKNSSKVLLFEKLYLLLRCILCKVKII